MMRVGIITLYHNNNNFGGLLQAYALQRTVSELGYDAKIIDYKYTFNNLHGGWRSKLIKIPFFLNFLHLLSSYRGYYIGRNQKHKALKKFAEAMPHTECVTRQTVSKTLEDIEAYICGSDQVWHLINWDATFFLDFVTKDKKTLSYAASVAKDTLTKKELEYICSMTESFNAVSVREANSAEMLNTFLNEDRVKIMPDPTLIRSKADWNQLCGTTKKKEKYLVSYFLGDNLEQREQAKQYAERHKLRYFNIPYLNKNGYKWEKVNNNPDFKCTTVNDFLTLIRDADIVVTDSFHGTVFSIIFEKAFCVLDRFEENDPHSMNSRLLNLLVEFHLEEHRTGMLAENFQYEIKTEELEFIRCRLSYLQKCSRDFLVSALMEDTK